MAVALRPAAKENIDIYRQDASLSDIFGELKGRLLLEAIWNTYQATEFDGLVCFILCEVRSTFFFSCAGSAGQVGNEKVRVKFFQDSQGNPTPSRGYVIRVKNIRRHYLNNRVQNGVKECYKQSCRLRGIVEGVRGEAWLCEPGVDGKTGERSGPYGALSFASLIESFYAALEDEPDNPNLLRTLSKGLECRIIHHRVPPAVAKYLVHLHNRFHQGSATSFCELLNLIPDVSCPEPESSLGN